MLIMDMVEYVLVSISLMLKRCLCPQPFGDLMQRLGMLCCDPGGACFNGLFENFIPDGP